MYFTRFIETYVPHRHLNMLTSPRMWLGVIVVHGCSYIQSWPDVYRGRQVKPGSPPPLPFDEPNAAAALLNLFHRLPVTNPPSVMEHLINDVLRLESTLPTYKCVPPDRSSRTRTRCAAHACLPWCVAFGGFRYVSFLSSPFRKPLARFIHRFPSEAIGYFLTHQRLVSSDNSNLLQCMLKDREAVAMRSRMMHETGTQNLVSLLKVRCEAVWVFGFYWCFAANCCANFSRSRDALTPTACCAVASHSGSLS